MFLPHKKMKATILSVVIAIVLASFVIYVIQIFDPSPKWDDYCDESIRGAEDC